MLHPCSVWSIGLHMIYLCFHWSMYSDCLQFSALFLFNCDSDKDTDGFERWCSLSFANSNESKSLVSSFFCICGVWCPSAKQHLVELLFIGSCPTCLIVFNTEELWPSSWPAWKKLCMEMSLPKTLNTLSVLL